MTARLDGKVCLVTGAAGGIGAAVVHAFQAEGATVIGADLAAADDVEHCDVAEAGSVDRLVDSIRDRHGRIDVLFHAAALLGGSGPFLEVARHEFTRFVTVNLVGSFLVGQAVARLMSATGTRGRIILVGSVNSFAAEPTAAPYVASKGGVRLLAKAMAVDLAPNGITVNLLAPGAVNVPRNKALFASAPVHRVHAQLVPAGGPGTPADIAHAALFLAEDGSRYITGAEIVVDGGLLAQILPPLA